jgi:hypothetical protein
MKIYFDPKPDITAFELAIIFARVGGGCAPRHGVEIEETQWNKMPLEMRRHWSSALPKD